MRCFSCCEPGHRQTASPKLGKRTFLVDGMELEGSDDVIVDDDILEDNILEEQVHGDTDTLLTLRCSCFSSKQFDDSWLRKSLFHSTCTVNDKMCHFIIDSCSCENVVSEDVVRKLSLKAEVHLSPYWFAWLKQSSEIKIVVLLRIRNQLCFYHVHTSRLNFTPESFSLWLRIVLPVELTPLSNRTRLSGK